MGGLIKRQHLTERQYLRANRVLCLILLVSYLVYGIVEIMNAKMQLNAGALSRCGVYAAAGVISLLMCLLFPRKKRTAVTMAIAYIIAFSVLVFGNGIVVIAMAFPVLIGFMIYLNSVIVGIGCFCALLIGFLKCLMVKSDPVLFNYGILLLAGYVVATVGAMSVVILLINFSKEDRAVIEEAAEHRKKVSETVAHIVENLYTDFTHMLHNRYNANVFKFIYASVAQSVHPPQRACRRQPRSGSWPSAVQHYCTETNELCWCSTVGSAADS